MGTTCTSPTPTVGSFSYSTRPASYKRSFGASQTVIPLNIAKNPKNNELYVTDRRMRTIFRYDLAGKYLGEFNPNLPPDQLPDVRHRGVQWAPVALRSRPDGTLYVTEILNGHRFLIFGPGWHVQEVGRQRRRGRRCQDSTGALPVPQRHRVP